MDGLRGLRQRHQAVFAAKLLRQMLSHRRAVFRQRLLYHSPQPFGRQFFCRAVDGNDPLKGCPVVRLVQDLEILHCHTLTPARDFARGDQPRAGRELVLEIVLVEPDQGDAAGLALDEDIEHASSAAVRHYCGLHHLSQHCLRYLIAKLRQWLQMGAVLVAKGIMLQKIAYSLDIQFG